MKTLFTFLVAAVAAVSMAQCTASAQAACGQSKNLVASQCASEKAAIDSHCAVTREEAFLAEARQMAMAAEGKKECCQSTAAKPMAKGDKGCCNEASQPAKFKVFVRGEGYKFFGCAGSAEQGRQALASNGSVVGKVQPVTGKARIG
jgi:hypothetical protein